MTFGDLANLFKKNPEPEFTSEIRDRRTSQKSGLSKDKLGVRNPKEGNRAITDEYKMNISQLKGAMMLRKKAWELSQRNNASPALQQFYKNDYDYYKMVFDLRNRGEIDVNKLHSYGFLDDRKEVINTDRQRIQKELDDLGRDDDSTRGKALKKLLRKLDQEKANIEQAQEINRKRNEEEKEKRKEKMETDEEKKFQEKDKKERDPELKEMDNESLKRYKENLEEQLRDAKDPIVQDGMKNSIADIEREEKRRQSKAQADAEANARKKANEDARQKDIEKQKEQNEKEKEEQERRDVNEKARQEDIEKKKKENEEQKNRARERDKALGRGVNNDIEDTNKHREQTDNDVILDMSLDFQHLGGSKSNFDNNFIGYLLKEFVGYSVNSLASRASGLDPQLTNLIVEPAVNKLPEFYNMLKNGLSSQYNRLSIQDKTRPFTKATIPLIIIILYLYLVDRSSDFKININILEDYIIRKILKNYFNFNDEVINFGVDIALNLPQELGNAYKKQKGKRENMITPNEVIAISKFIQYINIEYSKRFNKNLANELFNFENKQSLYLYEMLETLGSSSTLFQISSAFNTLNELIVEMVSNPYLIVQLMALIYDTSEKRNLASSDVLSRGKVDKLIYYYSDLQGGIKEDLKVKILKNIQLDMDKRGNVKDMTLIKNNDKVALYNYKGRYYVTFRGTDLKDEKDIRDNFLNFGGKDYLTDESYNERTKIGKQYLDLAIMKSKEEGLEPPAIIAYSLGGVSAMYLSTLYQNIETDVYAPILSRSELTENIMEYLGDSNIHFNYNEKDPIAKNMEYYRKKYINLDINKYKNNKFYSPHNLEQFI